MIYKLFFLVQFAICLLSLNLVAEDPTISVSLNESGVQAVQQKKFDDAEELFLEAIEKDPFNITAVFNLAGMYLANENPKDAVKLLSHYTAKDLKDAGLFSRLGDAYFAAQDLDLALKNYLAAYKLEPQYERLTGKIGTIYSLKNDLVNAEKFYVLALKSDPSSFTNLVNLSNLQLANKKYEASIASAKKALQIKAASSVYITLGTAYEMSNNRQNALISYKRAKDLGDQSPELTKKIESLEKK